ncbi:hypothetical protein Stsp02_51540 [Streptomyces sp. NBRC 14336]|uniref:hypothetical protein n=1 Tax=Streptomyces sp. NBRC 14336 TaxID=3030992 RepID=UPI0024A2ADD8|nr:hypothetical protein [Streptomyces sp. NBRC 14336]GLW49493.1 hypothetical protein Stsp02_51540 [Streptomyces sp. NBRC 14336]
MLFVETAQGVADAGGDVLAGAFARVAQSAWAAREARVSAQFVQQGGAFPVVGGRAGVVAPLDRAVDLCLQSFQVPAVASAGLLVQDLVGAHPVRGSHCFVLRVQQADRGNVLAGQAQQRVQVAQTLGVRQVHGVALVCQVPHLAVAAELARREGRLPVGRMRGEVLDAGEQVGHAQVLRLRRRLLQQRRKVMAAAGAPFDERADQFDAGP